MKRPIEFYPKPIIYSDQPPTLEEFGAIQPETALTFHAQGYRFILRQGKPLEVIRYGHSQDITPELKQLLIDAVSELGDLAVTAFVQENLEG